MKFVRKHRKASIIVLISLTIFLLISVTFGKYIYNVVDNYILETKGFYFNSSVLGINTKEYKINNWDGVNAYTLTIDLNNRKNTLKKTESDIEYNVTVSCSSGVNCTLTKDHDILRQSSDADSFQVVMSPTSNFSPGEVVEVTTTVTTTYPYKKVLSGKYYVTVETSNFTYNIEDAPKNKFLVLNLTNSIPYYQVETRFGSYRVGDLIGLEEFDTLTDAQKANCFSAIVTVNFNPQVLFLDMTDNTYIHRLSGSERTRSVNGYNYVYEYKFKVPATSSEKVIFYKADYINDYTYPIINSNSIVNVSVRTAG